MNTTAWRWFPMWLVAAMSVVFVANGTMVYQALHTFPGKAGEDGFALSNEYNRVIATAQQQAALGWQIEAGVTAQQVPELRLTDKHGAALSAAAIDAQAERPIGPAETTELRFRSLADGRFRADQALAPGQWDIMLTVRADNHRYSATRRVIVK